MFAHSLTQPVFKDHLLCLGSFWALPVENKTDEDLSSLGVCISGKSGEARNKLIKEQEILEKIHENSRQ